jgi:hypothetical protein
MVEGMAEIEPVGTELSAEEAAALEFLRKTPTAEGIVEE